MGGRKSQRNTKEKEVIGNNSDESKRKRVKEKNVRGGAQEKCVREKTSKGSKREV